METNPRGGHEPPQSQAALQIIWLALASAVVFYGVIAWMVVGSGAPSVRWTEMPVLALLGAGVALLFAAFIVPNVLASRSADETSGARVAPANNVPARVQRTLILRFAMLESGALLGLVAAFIGKSAQLFLPLGVLAILGMLLSFPNDSLIRRLDSR